MGELSAPLEQHCHRVVDELRAAVAQRDYERLRPVLVNFSTCCELAFLPALREVAERDLFYVLDDNGAGGAPRPSGEAYRLRAQAEALCRQLEENHRSLAPVSELARALTSGSAALVASALDRLARQPVADASLLPILERIASVDRFEGSRTFFLGKAARRAQLAILGIVGLPGP